MDSADRVFEILKLKNITAKQLSNITGISQGNITDWKKGRSKPSYGAIVKISNSLNVSENWILYGAGDIFRQQHTTKESALLSVEEKLLLQNYRNMNDEEKLYFQNQAAKLALKKPTENSNSQLKTKQQIVNNESKHVVDNEMLIKMRVYDQPASAGLGNYLDGDCTYEELHYNVNDVPAGADFGIRISGDSMEPNIKDGQIVWIKEQIKVENGQVGIFILDGEGLCKKLNINHDKREINLVSLNRKYKPIKVHDGCDFKTVGKVLFFKA